MAAGCDEEKQTHSMWSAQARTILEDFIRACTECGICGAECALQQEFKGAIRDLFHQVVTGQPSEEALRFVGRCALCGFCCVACPAELNIPKVMMAARQLLIESGATNLEDYQVMLVDQDVHLFTIYRETNGIQYDDLKQERCDTVFFPGCTLNAYGPALTRAAHAWLEKREGRVGFSEACCGLSLSEIGLAERAADYAAHLRTQLARMHAHRIVTACPNCYYYLQDTLKDMQVVSIYNLMEQDHFGIAGESVLAIHDSCPDRQGVIGSMLRRLLAGSRLVEMAHHGTTTLCCGSGGIVSLLDRELCAERARVRWEEFDQTGADQCVTACMACAYRLQRARPGNQVVHLLELAFGIRIDYEEVAARVHWMWEGEWGEYNRARLAAAKVAQ